MSYIDFLEKTFYPKRFQMRRQRLLAVLSLMKIRNMREAKELMAAPLEEWKAVWDKITGKTEAWLIRWRKA